MGKKDIYFDKVSTRGRAKLILNKNGLEVVEDLASIMCTEEEIANIIGASLDTLHNKDNDELFRTSIEKGQSKGKESLRRAQYNVAVNKGNATMLIWLGRNYLDQKETIEQSSDDETKETLNKVVDAMQRVRERINNGEQESRSSN